MLYEKNMENGFCYEFHEGEKIANGRKEIILWWVVTSEIEKESSIIVAKRNGIWKHDIRALKECMDLFQYDNLLSVSLTLFFDVILPQMLMIQLKWNPFGYLYIMLQQWIIICNQNESHVRNCSSMSRTMANFGDKLRNYQLLFSFLLLIYEE